MTEKIYYNNKYIYFNTYYIYNILYVPAEYKYNVCEVQLK